MNLCNGLWAAIVVDTKDPLGSRRVKVRVPELHGTVQDQTIKDVNLPWARPCFPYGGPTYGDDFVPGLQAQVWVAFEHGDPQSPIWVGCVYASGEGPAPEFAQVGPANQQPKGNYRRTEGGWFVGVIESASTKVYRAKSPTGMLVEVDESAKKVTVQTATGFKLELDESSSTVVLQDATGNKIELKTTDGGITHAVKALLEAPLIALGQAAAEPVVKGTSFLAAFIGHTHPGVTSGPASTGPATPLPPSILSSKVFTE